MRMEGTLLDSMILSIDGFVSLFLLIFFSWGQSRFCWQVGGFWDWVVETADLIGLLLCMSVIIKHLFYFVYSRCASFAVSS